MPDVASSSRHRLTCAIAPATAPPLDSKRDIQTCPVNHVKSNVFYVIAAVVVAVLLAVSAGSAGAQEQQVTVQTDDSHYNEGDTMVISGSVGIVIPGTPVILQVFATGNVLIDVAQIEVAQEDKSYSDTIILEGDKWNKGGKYTIRALYGEGRIAETTFRYSPESAPKSTTDIFEVDAGSYGTFDVEYTIRGGTLSDITVDSPNLGIVVEMETEDDGSITMNLPREFIGAEKQSGRDEVFIVLVDEVQTAYEETIGDSDSRVITVDFVQSDSRIDVIGTYVVPEFGAAVMIALGAGMAVAVLAARGRTALLQFSR